MHTRIRGDSDTTLNNEEPWDGSRRTDRRSSPRYDIRALVTLTYTRNRHPVVLSASTKDVSVRGAFVVSDTIIPAGTHVDFELHLEIDGLPRLIGSDRHISVATDGTVVRNEHHGFAAAFSSNISFKPISGR